MPRLAILIPWCDSHAAFEDTLASVLQHRPKRTEILVIHSHPYQDPYRIADEDVTLIEHPGASELELINVGLAQVNSPVVHVLSCGLEVEPDWAEAALTCFNDRSVSSVVPLVVERSNRDRLVSAGIGWGRSGERRLLGTGHSVATAESVSHQVQGPSLAAAFYRTEDVLALEGLNESLGRYADLDLALSLQALGQQALVCPESRLFGSAEPAPVAGYETGRQQERVFWRHATALNGRMQLVSHACRILAGMMIPFPSMARISQTVGRFSAMMARHNEFSFRERLNGVAIRGVHVLPSNDSKRQQRRLAA